MFTDTDILDCHGLTIDLYMLCAGRNVFLRYLSASAKSDKSDDTKRKPMQMISLESCVQHDMPYAAFLSKLPSSSSLLFSAAIALVERFDIEPFSDFSAK